MYIFQTLWTQVNDIKMRTVPKNKKFLTVVQCVGNYRLDVDKCKGSELFHMNDQCAIFIHPEMTTSDDMFNVVEFYPPDPAIYVKSLNKTWYDGEWLDGNTILDDSYTEVVYGDVQRYKGTLEPFVIYRQHSNSYYDEVFPGTRISLKTFSTTYDLYDNIFIVDKSPKIIFAVGSETEIAITTITSSSIDGDVYTYLATLYDNYSIPSYSNTDKTDVYTYTATIGGDFFNCIYYTITITKAAFQAHSKERLIPIGVWYRSRLSIENPFYIE